MPTFTTTPAKVRRPSQPPRGIDPGMADWFDNLGLTARADEIRAVFQRSAEIAGALAGYSVDLHNAKAQAIYEIIGGSTPQDAAIRFDAARRLAETAPLAAELAAAAGEQMQVDYARTMWRDGDALIHEIDAVVQAAVEHLTALAPTLDGIDTDSAAVRSNATAQRGWAEAINDTDRIVTAWALAFVLHSEEFVATIAEAGEHDWCYRNPSAVVDHAATDHPVRTMLANIAAGAGPCVATADEVVAAVYGP
jgi:hypothetical protein